MSESETKTVRDPGLPDLETISTWIRETRENLGLTQSEVGEEANLSPSQISRLESAQGNPSYEAVYRVYETLKSRQGPAVSQLLDRKRERTDGSIEFEYVTVEDSCERVSELMEKHDISQLPVMDAREEEVVGSVSEVDLMELNSPLDSVSVGEIARDPFPEVPATASLDSVRNLLRSYPAVLVTTSDESDEEAVVEKYAGILTRFDLRN